MRRPASSSGSSIRSRSYPFTHSPASGGVNRGCAYWSDGKPGGERRIIHGTSDGRLFSLDAATGKLDPKFGTSGILNLRDGLEPTFAVLDYGPTSAPAIWHDTIIVGVSCGEGPGIAAPGDIRAFDDPHRQGTLAFPNCSGAGRVRTGDVEGRFLEGLAAVPMPGVGLASTRGRGLVFAGLGSAAFDFYGGDRHGDNLFANCTIALDAQTGKRRWHFQTLHHDLWDHDLPVYPNLVTVNRDGKAVDAVAQVTKTGYVFVFDRETGKPLFDIKEQRVPASDVPGEQASPTQPIPVKPPPFAAQYLDETNVTNIGEANRSRCFEAASTDPRRAGIQSAELQRDGGRSRLSWRSDMVGGIVRSNDRVALRELEQCHRTSSRSPSPRRRQTELRAIRQRRLPEVSRPRGLSGNQATVGSLDGDQLEHG